MQKAKAVTAGEGGVRGVVDGKLIYQNAVEVLRMREAVKRICAYWRARRLRVKALLKRMAKPQNAAKLLKLQAFFRGHLSREKNKAIVDKIRANAPKKTKKYKQISKLQANIKGFLFRVRRKRLLSKLAEKNTQSKTSLFED